MYYYHSLATIRARKILKKITINLKIFYGTFLLTKTSENNQYFIKKHARHVFVDQIT